MMNKSNGFANIIIIIVLLIGTIVGTYLIQDSQIFKSRASEEPIVFVDLVDQNGQKISTDLTVKVRLTSPYGPTSPNVLGEETEVAPPSGILDYFIDALNELRVILSPQSSIFPSPTPTPVPAKPFFVPQRVDLPIIPTSTPIPVSTSAPSTSKSPDTVASPPAAILPTKTPSFTTGYRLAESEEGLRSVQYKPYISHPLIATHTFTSSEIGLKILYVQFKNNLNQESQAYSAAMRLISNSAAQSSVSVSTSSAVPSGSQEASVSAQQ